MSEIEQINARMDALEGVVDVLASHIDAQIDDIHAYLHKQIEFKNQLNQARELIKKAENVDKKFREFFKKTTKK